MTEPPAEVGYRGANVVWPPRMKVAYLQPRQQVGEFIGGGIQGDAVGEVEAPIAEGKDLGLQ